ncbi:MAG: hypothetical protein NC541_14580 [bacterium]|nr:hypothetical protein [bacterium]
MKRKSPGKEDGRAKRIVGQRELPGERESSGKRESPGGGMNPNGSGEVRKDELQTKG